VLAQAEEDQQLEEEQQLLQLEQECQEQQQAEEQQHQQLLLEFSGHEDEQLHRSRPRSGRHDGEWPQCKACTCVQALLLHCAVANSTANHHPRHAALGLVPDVEEIKSVMLCIATASQLSEQCMCCTICTLAAQASRSLLALVLASAAPQQGGVPLAAAAASAAQQQSHHHSRNHSTYTSL
jgi:hypothetical protein